MDSSQAEAVVETVRVAVVEGAATKTDVADLRADIADLRAETKADIADLRTSLYRALYTVGTALLAAQVAAVFALLRLLGG